MTDLPAANAPQHLKLSINSYLKDTVLVAMAVRGVCAMTSLSQTDINRFELCVVEVVNNAIEHAYCGEGGHQVEVDVFYTPDRSLEVVVSDFGTPMVPQGKTELQPLDPLNPDTWTASGRGLPIVERLMDKTRYQSSNGRNSFHMIRTLAQP